MDKNIKIAKQLVRLAKSLVAIDEEGDGSGFQVFHDLDNYGIKDGGKIADKPGKYKNFTGVIYFMGNFGKVENARFELDEHDSIIWHDGTWKNGIWKNGNWYNGTWEDGTWKGGTWWYDGTWKNGTWENGIWKGGTWEDGTWKKGHWECGYDADGYWYPENYSPNKWKK